MSKISLSNYTVKVYLKKNHKISFHLFTYLIFETNEYFNSTLLKNIECSFRFNNGNEMNFDKCQHVVSETEYDRTYSGKAKIIEIHMSKITDYFNLENGLIELKLKFKIKGLNYQPDEIYIHNEYGIIKKMYNEKLFKD